VSLHDPIYIYTHTHTRKKKLVHNDVMHCCVVVVEKCTLECHRVIRQVKFVTELRNYLQNCATPPEYNRFISAVIVPRLSKHEKYIGSDDSDTFNFYKIEGRMEEYMISTVYILDSNVLSLYRKKRYSLVG